MSDSFDQPSAPRWSAVATYRTGNGPVDVAYEFKDLFELHTLIARGPDPGALRDIRVTVVHDANEAVCLTTPLPERWAEPD